MVNLIELELPNNKKEADFVIELLKRLNIRFTQKQSTETEIIDDLIESNKELIDKRLDSIEKGGTTTYSWEDAQAILANRKLQTA
jgi:hypothetical protein